MPDQARGLLGVGLWGVPPTALLRARVRPGDEVLVAVGAPYRVFVGEAVVSVGYHRFSEDEAARFPSYLAFRYGIALSQARVWPSAVSVMSVWPRTSAAGANPNALFFGAITAIGSDDAAMIVAVGTAGQPRQTREGASFVGAAVASAAPSGSRGERKRPSGGRGGADPDGPSRIALGAAVETRPEVAVQGGVGPRVAIGLAARGLRAATTRPVWLPSRIAHADWGTASAKCVAAVAELDIDGAYVAHAPRVVGQVGGLLDRLHVGGTTGTSLLGFDFPIGVPRAYAHRAGIENFATWLRELDGDAPFFDVANDISEVTTARPFFPLNITIKNPGVKARFRAALGLSAAESLRRCDSAHAQRGAASEMFWTLGAKAVGKATLAGWRDAVKPALAEEGRRYAIWPFDGPLFDLIERFDAVIVETYPAEFYGQLGLGIGSVGHSKTSQDARRAEAPRLLDWCGQNGVIPDEELVRQIEDGFGPSKSGEDPFDAIVGLLGMINTVSVGSEPELPDDPAIRQLEGWMFGQHALLHQRRIVAPGNGRETRLVRVMRKSVPALDAVSEAEVRDRLTSYETELSHAGGTETCHQLTCLIAECRTALAPDFAHTKVHHRSNCWYVDRYQEGAFGGKRQFVLVPTGDLPEDVLGCQYCESGRPTPGMQRMSARHDGRSEPVPIRRGGIGLETDAGRVVLNRTVRVLDKRSETLRTWTVVPPSEADPTTGQLSAKSPIAKALLGHVAGETVRVETPSGPRHLEIKELMA